jgi:photosystem II stability/assembly factor-like uncharacterized protein
LVSVYFTDSNTGWAVGIGGTILKTTNGGTNWISQSSGTVEQLSSVYFTNSNTGWAVGTNGTILKTTNGGNNWIAQISGTANNLYSVYFTDSNTGWAVGIYGTILKTIDGGNNWTSQSSGTANILSSVYFMDLNTGWAVGGNQLYHYATILKTTDGGNIWTLQSSGTAEYLISVYFADSNIGWAVGFNGTIIKTSDGGDNWTAQTSGNTSHLNSVYFTDSNVGWAVGLNGTILKTINGGNPIPVELSSFTVSTKGREVILNWITATELNNQGFEIQRKFSSNDFVTIGSVKGNGTTTSPNQYTFVDKLIDPGKYFYRLKQVDFNGTFEYSSEIEVEVRVLDKFTLEQNYPNPFNPTTTIRFGIPEKGNVRLSILNILGEEIRVLLNEEKVAGYHSIDFNASELPSGVYVYRIQVGSFIDIKKMILLR